MAALNRDPDLNDRRQKTRLSKPENVATMKRNCAEAGRQWRATSEGSARLQEVARKNFLLMNTPEAVEKRRARDAEGGIRRTLRRVPGLPEAGIPLYRLLTKKKKLPRAEALRIVLEETPGTPEHARRSISKIDAAARAKEARRKEQAY